MSTLEVLYLILGIGFLIIFALFIWIAFLFIRILKIVNRILKKIDNYKVGVTSIFDIIVKVLGGGGKSGKR